MKNQNLLFRCSLIVSSFLVVNYAKAQFQKSPLLQIDSQKIKCKTDLPYKNEIMLTRISTEFYYNYNWANGTCFAIYDPILSVYKNFESIGYQTKRLGTLKMDTNGNISNETVPVFVQKSEYSFYLKRLKLYLKRLTGN